MKVLAYLEGRPIHVGDTLYDLEGANLEVMENTSRHKEFPLIAFCRRIRREWVTDTHFDGMQVLFWEPRTPEQLEEWRQHEESVRRAEREAEHQRWLSRLTDPDAYMMR